MISPTYGEVSMSRVAELIYEFVHRLGDYRTYHVTVGTDSQNFDKTKVVNVIAVHCEGKGGIFFYQIRKVPLIRNVKQKLTEETSCSLELAQELLDAMDAFAEERGWDYHKNLTFAIHVDAGPNGKSSRSIPSVTAWVRACGWSVETKPNSYAASSIANKYSK